MKRRRAAATLLIAFAAILPVTPARAAAVVQDGDASVVIDDGGVLVQNPTFDRRWTFGDDGSILHDKRRNTFWSSRSDFPSLATSLSVLHWVLDDASASVVPGGGVEARLSFRSAAPFRIERVVRTYPGTAGMRIQTIVHAGAAPVPLTGYVLEQLTRFGIDGASTARAINFSGGADWRDTYDYRSDTRGSNIEANAEWLETDDGSLGLLMQRRNYLSSRMAWLTNTARAAVDLSYDSAYLGPFEEERPAGAFPPPAPARTRIVPPLGSLALEPVIVAMGTGRDDLMWQSQQLLARDIRDYPRTINFNTDRVRGGPFEVGVRDGVDIQRFHRLWPVAKALGVETFVLDDGWQKYNGDWRPDPERYPNGLSPVRDTLEANGMRLGLWMAAGSFHPSSDTWRAHPEWTCLPVGGATAAYNAALPTSGSNAAGIGVWDFNAISTSGVRYRDKIRSDIEALTGSLNLTHFKFDFLVWLDCQSGSLYEQRDAFFGAIESLGDQFPGTGFGMDETNDYRGFPYESIQHGATWFQNGNPPQDAALHNAWLMAPYVPGYTIGQAVTIRPGDSAATIDEKMAAALSYQMTFWTDIGELAGNTAVLDRVRTWTDFAKAHRQTNGFAYPLLSDPRGRANWSGMQPWDAAANRGMAILHRFDAPNDTQTVAFRGLRDDSMYRVTDVTPTAAPLLVGEFSGADLRAGIPLMIATTGGVRVLSIEPV